MEQIKDDLGWLVRDTKNVIRGPFTYAVVLQMIKKGQVRGKTEISKANSYWFAIEEKNELGKFFPELGINTKVIEEPAEMTMTGTMTKAAEQAPESDYTTLTNITSKTDPEVSSENNESKIEWLSDEFADDFMGSDDETTIVGASDLMKRASAKADTLPHELKDSKTDRSRPMHTLFKSNSDKNQGSAQQVSATVTVPVTQMDTGAKIYRDDSVEEVVSKNKNVIYFGIAFLVLIISATAGIYLTNQNKKKINKSAGIVSTPKAESSMPRRNLAPADSAKRGLLLLDLEIAKEAAAQLEAVNKNDPIFLLTQGLIKKELLSDSDGAIRSLRLAQQASSEPKMSAEIDNILGIYTYDSSAEESISHFKKSLSQENLPIFHYNMGLANFRARKFSDAISSLSGITVPNDNSLAEDYFVLLGWSKYFSGATDGSDEQMFQKALNVNPSSAKARLGLAVKKLRSKADKGEDILKAVKDSEVEFRSFLDLAPEVDSSASVPEFRKMNDFEIYALARKEIAELNVPDGRAKTRPSSVIMAADAMLSSLLSRSGESLNIVDAAMKLAPGDANTLKAYGYLRWKESRYDDVIELLKDNEKLKNSYAANLLLGKSYEKNGRLDLTEKHFQALTLISPGRAEGWALMGTIRFKQKNIAEAKKLFKIALEKDPNNLDAVRGLEEANEDIVLSSNFYKEKLPF